MREPSLDLLRAQDEGLKGMADPAILGWAAHNNRIILTHDRATLADHAFQRVRTGNEMAGVFLLNDRFPVGQAIHEILLMVACSEQSEWRNRVIYVPL